MVDAGTLTVSLISLRADRGIWMNRTIDFSCELQNMDLNVRVLVWASRRLDSACEGLGWTIKMLAWASWGLTSACWERFWMWWTLSWAFWRLTLLAWWLMLAAEERNFLSLDVRCGRVGMSIVGIDWHVLRIDIVVFELRLVVLGSRADGGLSFFRITRSSRFPFPEW